MNLAAKEKEKQHNLNKMDKLLRDLLIIHAAEDFKVYVSMFMCMYVFEAEEQRAPRLSHVVHHRHQKYRF